ncbi:ribulokinase [Aquimarina celericrescens]|uniref:Ribulokinase n=1 Tax=Aquimarina celericrescens TaxID=1964542 RepID=A0ABW5B0V2_9FLAO|nr:ribulokinase [Aquimarina celericrescens]
MKQTFVIGVDFGTDSVRAILVNTSDGTIVAESIFEYPRWKQGLYCKPEKQQFRQHPLDHIEGLKDTINNIVKDAKIEQSAIKGICVDTTGSSPIPVDSDGNALALQKDFSENPDAMMILWKDHTAIKEAEEITRLAKTWGGPNFTEFVGGVYSSEWFWAKILFSIRNNESIRSAAYSWMEHCDYITFLLTENKDLKTFKRSRCAAGHKAMWNRLWGGLPSEEFLSRLDPYLGSLRSRLYEETYTSNEPAGTLSKEWSEKLGLSESTIITVGTFDAHAGAVGSEIKKNTLVKVMGTSTCDIIVSSKENLHNMALPGICGQVDGSVLPNFTGLEAGQSAFGDLLAWFVEILYWPIKQVGHSDDNLLEVSKEDIHKMLSSKAEKIPDQASLPLSIDWINGRRTPHANQTLKAAIANLDLGTTAPHIYKSLIEAIGYGAKNILEHFEEREVEIQTVIGVGGVAKKSPLAMQTLANILNMPIHIAKTEQACALGAAMYAAVASGIHSNLQDAILKMGHGFEITYYPEKSAVIQYQHTYKNYLKLGAFVEYTSLNTKAYV